MRKMKMKLVKTIWDENDKFLSQPDPYIIEAEGKFYIYATNSRGVACYQSDKLGDFIYQGLVLQVKGEKEFWAPSVIKIASNYYMYYSSISEDCNDLHQQRIKVAVATNPLGPFKYVCDLLPPFSIDPHVVIAKNELYIFYSINDYEAQRAGTYIVLDKMLDPFRVEGKPVPVVRPTLDEEIFAFDRYKQGQHWHTIEGAFYLNVDDYHYLMYSGGSYGNDSYFIGYSYAVGTVNDLRELNFQKYPNKNTYFPLLKNDDYSEGMGHNSVIKTNEKYYIVYHGRDYGLNNPNYDTRTARIAELIFNKDKITVKKFG